jgi:hypothetical protein
MLDNAAERFYYLNEWQRFEREQPVVKRVPSLQPSCERKKKAGNCSYYPLSGR